MSDSSRLPPLTALRAFEAASRHLSFAKAAQELFVTPAALSFQIKSLEEHLGVTLFRRLNRAVELTEPGRALQPGLAAAFREMHEAVRAVERMKEGAPLTVTAGPAFTAKWLAPRFFRFAEAHPEIELRFVASLKIMDFDRDGIDVAVRYTPRPDDTAYCELMIDEWVIPAAAPAVAERIATPADILHETLLHDDSINHLRPAMTWAVWLRAAGLAPGAEAERGSRFSSADHAIDAAVEGAGVILARASLIERDLAAGRLVTPLPMGLMTPGKYYFLCRKGAEAEPRIETFLDWMREEVASIAAMGTRFDLRPFPD
ncbi:transcriptional regulator GcvA [Limibaculum sp. M0105]|uniref:Transcriptional regulator GcvA n=1 Tax=Thermohalobaculum xanthum TaxID=2753746 RepID=A0A8J7M931_9RHOB|nr:transcriptional regulator GcvA [Thermohalobaculum xanthum]MBK0400087.1 transcriptional regulator GcvA [Thermohalobaculum xanthum]